MQIGSLWSGKDKNDNSYLSGEIDLVFGKIRIGVFKNTNKEDGSKQPDYRVVKLEERKNTETTYPESPEGDPAF